MLSEKEQRMLAEAWADLGNHRMTTLPLAGKQVSKKQLDKLNKPIDLRNVKEDIVEWHTALIEDDIVVPARDDGIGSGGLHRLGPNYRPPGAGPIRTSIGAASRGYNPAGYAGRRHCLSRSTSQQLSSSRYSSHIAGQKPAESLSIPQQSSTPKDNLSQKDNRTTSKENRPSPTIARSVPPSIGKPVTSELRPKYDPGRLVNEPFWTKPSSSHSIVSLPSSQVSTGALVGEKRGTLDSNVNLESTGQYRKAPPSKDKKYAPVSSPLTPTIGQQSAATSTCIHQESSKWSTKGSIQIISEEVPAHFKTVTFPARKPSPIDRGLESDRTSEHCSEIYSDPDISHKPASEAREENSRVAAKFDDITHAHAHADDEQETRELLARLQLGGLRISTEFDDENVAEAPSTKAAVSQVLKAQAEQVIQETGILLFTLKYLGKSWPIYSHHEPSKVAQSIFHEFDIRDQADRDHIRNQIVKRFDKNLKKFKRR